MKSALPREGAAVPLTPSVSWLGWAAVARPSREKKGLKVLLSRSNPMSENEIALHNPPTDGVTACRFSPDSSHLIVSSWDCSLSLHSRLPPSWGRRRISAS